MSELPRLAYTNASPKLLANMFKTQFYSAGTLVSNLPKDAVLFGISDLRSETPRLSDRPCDMIRLVWQSREFAEIPEGAEIPRFDVYLRWERADA